MRFALFALLLLTIAAPARAAQPNGCPDYVPPTVTVHRLFAKPQVEGAFDLASIRRLAEDGKKEFSSTRHETPVALTAASLKLDTQYEVAVQGNPTDPLVCAQVKAFDIYFGFEDTTIYVARELPSGSCSLFEVLEHERRHVAADYSLLQSTQNVVRENLRQALARIGTVRASSGDVAERQIQGAIRQYMKTMGEALSAARQDLQAAIDTEAEYDRLSRACDGALSDLIRENKGAGG